MYAVHTKSLVMEIMSRGSRLEIRLAYTEPAAWLNQPCRHRKTSLLGARICI